MRYLSITLIQYHVISVSRYSSITLLQITMSHSLVLSICISRRMYWTDWGTQAKIERARLDGTDRQPLITTALGYPNGLVLDPERRLMYWADAVLDRIEVANMDGSSRKTLLIKSGLHPFAIVIIGNNR